MANRETKTPKISLVVINYQTDSLILDLLSGLIPNKDIEIIIVDQSPINTLENKLPKRSDTFYFFTGTNLGFSGGNNYGISKSKGEWVMLLNSDTKTSSEDLLKLLDITTQNHFLVSTPKLVHPDGKTQNSVGYFDDLFYSPINYVFGRPRFVDCNELISNTSVDLLIGTAMLIHRSVFENIGLLDEKHFFMYFEDIDFSQRLCHAGIKVLYVPKIKIMHLGGMSSDQDKRQKNLNYQNGLRAYLVKHRGPVIHLLNTFLHIFN